MARFTSLHLSDRFSNGRVFFTQNILRLVVVLLTRDVLICEANTGVALLVSVYQLCHISCALISY